MAKTALLFVSSLALASFPCACRSESKPEPETHAATATNADPRLDWWRDARFGLFLHWGLYSIPAGEWEGKTDHGEWILTTAQIPVSRYEHFREQFNPVKFDARAWARLAKRAGMRYVVITSKHHDGFCLFDSKETDYDVMSTPFQRDILKELSQACAEEGLKMCWYHSIMDWHHPDYLPRREWEDRSAEGADFSRYVKHLHRQVAELLTNYGPIGVMWFDGEWEETWTHEEGRALYEWCRKLQPNVIVNNRVDKGRAGMEGMTTDASFAGDFGTPEQEIPATGLPGVDWETCMTMNDHWGYNAHDQDWKSDEDLIRKLVDIASKGGNFLLNVGPTAAGEFPPASVERLEAIGRWMGVNGEAIHDTQASPFDALAWGRCTMRREGDTTRLYLHVFDWPLDGKLVLPGLGNTILRARLLAQPGVGVPVASADANVTLRLPRNAPDRIASVIALDIRGAPIVFRTPKIVAESDVLVQPLEVRIEPGSSDVEVHYTIDGTDPSLGSPCYAKPFPVADTTSVRARAFYDDKPVSAIASAQFTRVAPAPAVAGDVHDVRAGLYCSSYSGEWDHLPDFSALHPESGSVETALRLPSGTPRERCARVYTGFLRVPSDAVYAFALSSDDGSRLYVDGATVVDNDGLHSPLEKRGTAALAAGLHPIRVEWFNKTGGAELELRAGAIGQPLLELASDMLAHR